MIQNKETIPKLQDIIKIEEKRVVYVDWKADFGLLDLIYKSNEDARKSEPFKLRSRLYSFLRVKKVITSIKNSNTIRIYFRIKRVYEPIEPCHYETGPTHNGLSYYFFSGYREIAEDWIDNAMKHNTKIEIFIPDEIG